MNIQSISYYIALLCFAVSGPNALAQQVISRNEVSEIIDLYVDEQYEIVKAKLNNFGFVITQTTPAYILKGVKHRGEFVMKRTQRQNLDSADSFEFQTVSSPSAYTGYSAEREISVRIHFIGLSVSNLFGDIKNSWGNKGTIHTTPCQSNQQCYNLDTETEVKAHNPFRDIGLEKAKDLTLFFLTLSGEQSEPKNPDSRDALDGFFIKRLLFRKHRPDIGSKRPIVRK